MIFVSAAYYEDSVQTYNISSDLYINEELKIALDPELLTNTVTASQKRIFGIQFDDDKFCKNSYYKVDSSEVQATSYGTNITNTNYLTMLSSVYIEESQILLTLDAYMNLHEFKVQINGTYNRQYIQMIKPTVQDSYKDQSYTNTWIFYSKTDDIVIANCKNFHYTIYLSKIIESNTTSASSMNVTDNLAGSYQYERENLRKMIQMTNTSRFLLIYSNAFVFHEIKKASLSQSFSLNEVTAFKDTFVVRDGSISQLSVYILTGDSKIKQFSYSYKSNGFTITLDKTLNCDAPFIQGTSFLVSKIGSANSKVNDKLFYIGGELTGIDYNQDNYCVAEYYVNSKGTDLVYNRHYCSNEQIESIEVNDRFVFVQRQSIHQFLYHSIPKDLLDSSKTQNYLISQQLMHYTLHQQGNNSYYMVNIQKSNSYSIQLFFIEETEPNIVCLADSSYAQGDYELLYKMESSHCSSNQEVNTQTGCKMYQKIKIKLDEYESNSKTGLIVGLIIGCVVVMLIVIGLVYFFLNRKFTQKYEQMKEELESNKYNQQHYQTPPKQIQYPQPIQQEEVKLELN